MLDVNEDFITSNSIEPGTEIALREKEGFLIGILTVSDIWTPDKKIEAEAIYKTTNTHHPGVNHLFNSTKDVYIGGEITVYTELYKITKLIAYGSSFLSSNDPRVHFGLGSGSMVENIIVKWSDGLEEEFGEFDINQHIRLEKLTGAILQ